MGATCGQGPGRKGVSGTGVGRTIGSNGNDKNCRIVVILDSIISTDTTQHIPHYLYSCDKN